MPQVIWTRPALGDLERLIHFLKHKHPFAAGRAASAIIDAGNHTAQTPHIGWQMHDDTHTMIRSGGNYWFRLGNMLYLRRVIDEGNNVVVLRVWHSCENRRD